MKKKKQIDKKPRYIQNLLVQAEKRKIEYERRNERLIQKERETEGNEFKDKEAFVTSSYKKKLEELKKLDEEDLKLSLIEDINDVTKQKDMGSFYRHLFKSELCNNDDDKNNDNGDSKKPKKSDANRQYRKRASSNSSNDKDNDISDSDSSVDESKRKKIENNNEDVKIKIADKSKVKLEEKLSDEEKCKVEAEEESSNDKSKLKENITKDISEVRKIEKNESIPKDIIPKINIWKKRTIGDIYEAARQRYFERKMKQIN
uniref:Nuclear speckle splicing regulatory protein 1 n=2 Tax=Sipha flava TaxID=143950 RepID=A0A2S2QVN6_9HEMI